MSTGQPTAPASPINTCVFDYTKWEAKLPELRKRYQNDHPFQHIVLENLINPELAHRGHAEFPKPDSGDWIEYRHVNENKMGQNKREAIPATHLGIIDELNSERFLKFLRTLTGIPNLIADPRLEGGGLHQITRGGFLNIHADFTAHAHQPLWARRVNLLLYLNDGWKEEYGGSLELWDRQMKGCVTKVLPILNRCVIFNTDPDTYHGHPEPLTCPEGMTRKSIALYYFTVESQKPYTRSTEYRARPQDGVIRSALIFADKMALRSYDFLKRRFGFDDRFISKILRLFK
jgi:Rps23 Pro-64 3,4-dihydroxylase Tpa1-like proline 4-hydroxylase